MKFFKNRKASVFGMDARITLAVTSILMLVVSVNHFSNVDRNNEIQVESELKLIRNAVESFYTENYDVPFVEGLLEQKYLTLQDGVNSDPWGNGYEVGFVINEEILYDSFMDVKYVYVLSYGKNGVKDTALPVGKSGWLSLEAASDDKLIKFNTMEQDKVFAEIEQTQLSIVKLLLESYIRSKEQENADFCSIVANQLSSNCDINQDGKYSYKEEMDLNYAPKETSDYNGKYYITTNSTYGTDNIFKSGYINTATDFQYNMYTFMDLIGGNYSYVNSPRKGLVLHFNSNRYGNIESPYFAQIWYGPEVTIF